MITRSLAQLCAQRVQAGIASAALASAAVGVTNVVGTVVAASLMDRAGRKQLLTLSFSGMGLSMLVMAAGLGLQSLAAYAGPIALVRSRGSSRTCSRCAWKAKVCERAGRKQLLTLSFSGMGLSLLVMAAGLGLQSLAAYAGPIALVRSCGSFGIIEKTRLERRGV